ncbi:MAG: DNA-processing protein DprA [Lysinibacillus sp.]
MQQQFTHTLLALVHSHPIRMPQLQKILQICPTLEQFPQIPLEQLSEIFRLPPERINLIKKTFIHHLNTSLIQMYKEQNIHIIPYISNDYPMKLLDLFDPPVIIFAKGNIKLLKQHLCIACIGSRQATAYSVEALKLLLPPLLSEKITIVSGLARGADTFAHKLTVHYGGSTIAVLGHGLHMIYPKENESLARVLEQEHLLISEYPLNVGPQKYHFPMRNRIISGLSEALIVTEANIRSGTMITTEHALETGKDVFVVPGPITSPLSNGTNKLIREGAIPVWNGYQIIEELQRLSINN